MLNFDWFYSFNKSGLCPIVFTVNKLKCCEILGCFALSLSMWYQQTKTVNTFRLVDPHSYISICIDTEAEKFTGWHVSECRFSITQVFVLEKSGIVTSSIFWPFSPEKAIQTTWACNFKGMTGSKTNNNRYSRQLWQISWHILVFVSSFTN